jgi:hypothetical protein
MGTHPSKVQGINRYNLKKKQSKQSTKTKEGEDPMQRGLMVTK